MDITKRTTPSRLGFGLVEKIVKMGNEYSY